MPNNTVILMSDEHNPLYSSPYGHPSVSTPNMERLVTQGTLYQNAYCPCPLCLPCRSSFLSGLRVHQVQSYNNCNLLLPSDLPTFGGALEERGVTAGFTGKTDIYRPGETMGFSFTAELGDREIPGDTNFMSSVRQGARDRANGFGVDQDAHGTDSDRVNAALRWLEDRKTDDNPWVLAVNITAPHFPHVTTEELWDLYPDGGDLPRYGDEEESARHPVARQLRDYFETDHFSESQARGLRRGYLSCVTYVDRQLGRILEVLESRNLLSTTNLIYTSDHGEMLGKFGMWWKCSLYEDSVRVPVMAMGPDFHAGARVETPVDLHDVRASAFLSAGRRQPDGWHGTALQSIPPDDRDRVVFSEYHGHGVTEASYMIRRGRWKLHYHVGAPHQLFDLSIDPDELANVFDQNRGEGEALIAALRTFCDPEAESQRSRSFIARQAEAVSGG